MVRMGREGEERRTVIQRWGGDRVLYDDGRGLGGAEETGWVLGWALERGGRGEVHD